MKNNGINKVNTGLYFGYALGIMLLALVIGSVLNALGDKTNRLETQIDELQTEMVLQKGVIRALEAATTNQSLESEQLRTKIELLEAEVEDRREAVSYILNAWSKAPLGPTMNEHYLKLFVRALEK